MIGCHNIIIVNTNHDGVIINISSTHKVNDVAFVSILLFTFCTNMEINPTKRRIKVEL